MTFDLKGFCQLMDRSSSGDGSFAAKIGTLSRISHQTSCLYATYTLHLHVALSYVRTCVHATVTDIVHSLTWFPLPFPHC